MCNHYVVTVRSFLNQNVSPQHFRLKSQGSICARSNHTANKKSYDIKYADKKQLFSLKEWGWSSWNRRRNFNFWTKLFAFQFALMSFEKALISLFSPTPPIGK